MKPEYRTRRRRPNISVLLVTPLALAVLGASGASAQSGHRVPVGGTDHPGTVSVTPRSAAVGDVVWIRTANLPPTTSVQFMLGALREGFEIVVTRVTDEAGRMDGQDSLQVTVPEWVTTDRPYLMIVTDTAYNPLGTADVFHPTDANGILRRVGDVKLEGTGCPVLTGQAEEIYFLIGDTSTIRTGDRVKVIGRAVESGACGAGTTIEMQQIEKMEPSP